MLLEIIVIVLRETLEASVLIAVLLSVSKSRGFSLTWLSVSLVTGLVGAVGYGGSLGVISEWFDYAGQEVVNSSLQLMVYALIANLVPFQCLGIASLRSELRNLMSIIVFLVLVREGAELYIFYSGFMQKEGALLKALTSGFVGLSVGLSVGAIVYYALAMMSQTRARFFHAGILALVGAGMMLQATQLLMQVDWLSSGEPLWNSSAFLTESSIVGQVAYAIFGYEATPTLIEVLAYILSIVGIVLLTLIAIQLDKKLRNTQE